MNKQDLRQLKIDLIEETEAYWHPQLDELFALAERSMEHDEQSITIMPEDIIKDLKIVNHAVENLPYYILNLQEISAIELLNRALNVLKNKQEGHWETGKPKKTGWYWVRLPGCENDALDPIPLSFDGFYFWGSKGFCALPITTVKYWSIPIEIPPVNVNEK